MMKVLLWSLVLTVTPVKTDSGRSQLCSESPSGITYGAD